MQQESRVKKSLLNARVNLIFYFLTLLLSFFSRKIFLDCLGADFVGLTTTMQNLLGFLNLAELGIGSAIGYVLYKPLFEHNEQKINEIISVFGYLYRWIGLIILGAGIILGGFLPLIFPSTPFEMGIIYFAYLSFLASSLIGYFANYKQTLLGADQKNYVVTAYFQTANIIKTLIQMASAYYTGSYYLWVIIELTFGIIYSFILNWKIRQVYPWLKSEVRQGRQLFKKYPEVMKYTKQLFVHKIGALVQFQASPLLIYAFVNLKTVAYYTNYTIITDKLSILVNNLLGSTSAGVGNLIAEGNKDKIINTYWELSAIRFWIASIITFTIYSTLPSFIALWIGDEYILPHSVLVILCVNFFIGITRGTTEQFLYGYGLFYDTWAPIIESLCYIISATILGSKYGLPGILLGNTCSLIIIVCLWKPYFLFSKGIKTPVLHYWRKYFKNIILCVIAFLFTNLAMHFITFPLINNWSLLIITCITSVCIYSIFITILLCVFEKGMLNFITRIKHIIHK